MAYNSKYEKYKEKFDEIDQIIVDTMDKYGILLLRYSLGLIFIWFGILKPFGLSTANDLVEKTVFWFDPEWFIPVLGIWEVLIGIGLIIRRLNRVAIFLLYLQMGGTFLPLILLPEATFEQFPIVPTLEGQYIIKNLVIISASLVIGGKVREKPEQVPKKI